MYLVTFMLMNTCFFNLNQDRTHMHCECVSGKVMVCPCDVYMALLLLEGQVSAATHCVYK